MVEKLKIGIDIDDVVAEFFKPYLEFHNSKFNTSHDFEDITNPFIWEQLGFSVEEMQPHFEDFEKNSTPVKDFPLVEHSKEAIDELAETCDIFIISSRPNKLFDETVLFFEKNFPGNNFEIIFSGEIHDEDKRNLSKHEICNNLGINVMVEDNPTYAFECARNGIKTFLIDRPWNRVFEEHDNIIKVNGWKEVLDHLNDK